MRSIARTVALGASIAAISLTGCSNHADQSSSPSTTGSTAGSTVAAPKMNLVVPTLPASIAPSAPAKKNYTIEVSLLTKDDDFYKALQKGLEDEAKKLGVTVEIVSAEKDLNKQISQVQNFVSKKPDAIVLCPVDSQGVLTALSEANSANIPVFTADIASKGGTVVSHIASDNVAGGRLVGEYAAKTVLNGKGNVVILDQKTVSSVQDRVKGFREALDKYPGIKVIDDVDVPDAKRENAYPKTTNELSAHGDVNLFFGINDNVALGALQALAAQKRSDVAVVGFDANPEAQSFIASKSQLKADAIQYPGLIGKATIDTIVKSLNGEAVPKVIPVPTGLVTSDSFSAK